MPRRKLGVKNNPINEKVPFLQKINIWKWLFLGLVSLLLAFAIVVQGRLATPREDVSQLHQAVGTKDVKVGTMTTTRDQLNEIPQRMVLQLLSKNKNIPRFVQISPKQSTITIVLPEIDNDFGIYVKANTIDLYNDKIVFDLYQKK